MSSMKRPFWQRGRDKDSITMSELEEAIERSVAGLERKSRVLNEKERRIVAYHEAGHAIVGEILPEANPVQKISIVSRGIAALGYTLNMPLEDRYLMTKEELEDSLAAILGGRAAEEIVFGEISTGAANDLQQATQMAERMVKEFGMSQRIGLVAHRTDRSQQLLGMPSADRRTATRRPSSSTKKSRASSAQGTRGPRTYSPSIGRRWRMSSRYSLRTR